MAARSRGGPARDVGQDIDNVELELRLTGKLHDLRKEIVSQMNQKFDGVNAALTEIMEELREIKERLP